MDNKINVKLLSMAGQGGSAFGITLMELMKERDDIMVLSADMSTPAGLDKFKAAYPDHFMNVGIAEQNMIGIAAGLADEGYKVICVAQACFITMRCFEQVRQYAGYMGIPMILVGIGSGLSLQYMGNTHYALEDIALMRTIPGMTIVAPCDSLEACKALECAIRNNGSTYIRFYGGTGIPAVHFDNIEFELGKAIKLREGRDVQILATGSMVGKSFEVAEELTIDGVEASVIDMHTIKPLDVRAVDLKKKLLVVLEEHNVNGGLGSSVSEILRCYKSHPKLLKLGINVCYVPVGNYNYLLKQCGLSIDNIKSMILNNL